MKRTLFALVGLAFLASPAFADSLEQVQATYSAALPSSEHWSSAGNPPNTFSRTYSSTRSEPTTVTTSTEVPYSDGGIFYYNEDNVPQSLLGPTGGGAYIVTSTGPGPDKTINTKVTETKVTGLIVNGPGDYTGTVTDGPTTTVDVP